MIESQIPLWAGIPASILLVLGGLLALTGSAGLLRFRSFYARIHAPTLGNTLGCGCVLASSMLVFSALSSRPVFHEVIITLLLIVSSPVTAMLLMRAATYRGSLKREDADRTPARGEEQGNKGRNMYRPMTASRLLRCVMLERGRAVRGRLARAQVRAGLLRRAAPKWMKLQLTFPRRWTCPGSAGVG